MKRQKDEDEEELFLSNKKSSRISANDNLRVYKSA